MVTGGCNLNSTLLPGSGSSIIVWVARCCSPTGWIGAQSQSLWAIPGSRKSRESFAASRTATGWAGDRCITGPTARFASTLSIACSASSLLQHPHKQAQSAWNGISTEQLLEELRQIQQFVLLYPPQGEKGPNRIATVLSKTDPPAASPSQNPGLGPTAYG